MSLAASGVWGPVDDRNLAPLTGAGLDSFSSEARALRLFQSAIPVFAFALPLAVVPGLGHVFSTPKLALLTVVVASGLAICWRRVEQAWQTLPLGVGRALLFWVTVVSASSVWGRFASLESLLLWLAAAGWLLLLAAVRPQPERLAWALVLSGSVVAATALAQFLHADPFALFGWIPAIEGSARMRIFATLGNPNFVAAFLAATLPVTFVLADRKRERRLLLIGLLLLQVAAIVATGSRAPIVALAAAALWLAFLKQRKPWRALGLVAIFIVIGAAVGSRARDFQSTANGRVYIWKVSAPHLREHFALGLGPGGFAVAFPSWESQYWQSAPEELDRKFAGIEDHAHNDYLEIFADYGAAGLLGFLALLAASLRVAWLRMRSADDPLVAGASAGVVSLAAVAFVDFPLMRPTETFLLWSLMAISVLRNGDPFTRQDDNTKQV